MGEMGEYWRDLAHIKQVEKSGRLIEAHDRLTMAGVVFAAHNGGVHFRVSARGTTVDYWPSTMMWRHGGKTYFGEVEDFLAWIGKK